MKDRARARELAAEFHRKGDPMGWFEPLYQEGEAGKSTVPWANLSPNPRLLDFWKAQPQPTVRKTALTIGCGLGDDAEQLAAWGFRTTALPLTRSELSPFTVVGLQELSFEDLLDVEDLGEPPVRRFRVLYAAKSV